MAGLSPLGLIEAALSSDETTDWHPPLAEDLEPYFPGYRDFAFIDRGGMGAVYSATQTSLDRKVAIKVLPPDLGEDPLFVDIFQSEARLLARLQHPNVVAIYDFGRSELGLLYIVMEYVEGISLLEMLKREGALKPVRAFKIAAQVCDGLQFAHDRGVIHRDIKPTNILIDDSDSVRVADFGLAQGLQLGKPSLTPRGRMLRVGTPVYSAPEQMKPGAVVDGRADVYSLGVTLYEMLTGKLPSVPLKAPSKVAEVPSMVDKIILQAMDPDPDCRPESAVDMSASLRKVAKRLSTPVLSHTISQRPIVSMMTTVIITICMIYLLDELENMVRRQKARTTALAKSISEMLVKIDDQFTLLNIPMTWDTAYSQSQKLKEYELASIHSTEEAARLQKVLSEMNITESIWLGGISKTGANDAFVWADQSPWTYAHWMPDSDKDKIVLSEIQPINQSQPLGPDGSMPDWIELRNDGDTVVDLTGWQFVFMNPSGTWRTRIGDLKTRGSPSMLMSPGDHRVLICSDQLKDTSSAPFIPFSLDERQGRIAWLSPSGRRIQVFDRQWVQIHGPRSLVSDETGHGWSLSSVLTPGAPNKTLTRKFHLDTRPRATRMAVMMLPSWGGHWTQENPETTALVLLKRQKTNASQIKTPDRASNQPAP